MSSLSPDRNLLIGILALQMDFISKDHLVAAMNAWVLDKAKPLEEILLDSGALRSDTHELLVAMTAKHIELHGGQAELSIRHISSLATVRDELESIADDDLDASLSHATCSLQVDSMEFTQPFGLGETTSNGQRFQILRPHAKGGLGEVFVARDEELNRDVALKQIRPKYADDADSRARFTAEAEITGGLEHPNIVPVYGLGRGQAGRPFYAMRLIHGDSLKDAVRRFHGNGASSAPTRLIVGPEAVKFRKLLGRLIDVCDAVEYAHSRGIVHRDIKPANIMLGKYGETLVVDWGLAKPVGRPVDSTHKSSEPTLHPSSREESTATRMGSAVGTPAFMSPEQATGQLDRIGPSSDVYSLGATLYFLLTGRPPIEDQDLGTSLRKATFGDYPRPRDVHPGIPRPLESICTKAMSVDPADRYASATELAEDIQRWLADEPVKSFQEPLAARLRRSMRRHRSVVTGSAAAILVTFASLAVGIVLLSSKNQELEAAVKRESIANAELQVANAAETDAKKHAQRRFDLALEAIDDYYTGVSQDVLLEREDLADLRKKLLRSPLAFYERLQDELSGDDDPLSQVALARAFSGIAAITASVGSKEEAIVSHRRAVEILEKLVRDDPENAELRGELAKKYNRLGIVQRVTGRINEALASYRKSIEIREALAADVPDAASRQNDVAASYNNLGNLQRDLGQSKEALASYQKALEIRERLIRDHPDSDTLRSGLARSHNNLGVIQRQLGMITEALASYEKAIEIRSALVREHPDNKALQDDLASTYNNISVVQRVEGNRPESLESSRRAIAIREQLVAENPNVIEYQQGLAATYNNFGNLQRAAGMTTDSLSSLSRVVEICENLIADNPNVNEIQSGLATSYHNLAVLQRRIGKHAEAQAAFERAIELRGQLAKAKPNDNAIKNELAGSLLNLGVLLRETANNDGALAAYQQAIDIGKTIVADEPEVRLFQEDLASCYNNLGNLLSSMGQENDALSAFEMNLEIQERLAVENPENQGIRDDLARTYHNLGVLQRNMERTENALASWQRAIDLREQVVQERPTSKSYVSNLLKSLRLRATLLDDQKRHDEAAENWRRAVELTDGKRQASYRARLAFALANAGHHEPATRVANQLVASEETEPEAIYDAGCVFALAAGVATQGETPNAGVRRATGEQYATRAVDLLTRAFDEGYFEDAAAVEAMEQDTGLAPLRDRVDFQALLKLILKNAPRDSQ